MAMSDYFIDVFIGLTGGALLVLTAFVILYFFHYLMSLPVRRRDQLLLFLDVLETIELYHQNVEAGILAIANSKDTSMGIEFHLVAAHIQNGCRLSEALTRAPKFLPAPLTAI